MAAPKLMTTDEYLVTNETVRPQELIYGVLRVGEVPRPRHQQIIAQLLIPLAQHVKQGRLGTVWIAPLDVVLDDARALVVQPDLFFITWDRMPFVPDRIRLAPDIVIEVLSPQPRVGSLEERIGWYASYGVCECWLIHQQERRTEVLQLAEGGIGGRESYGWEVPVRSTILPDFRPVIYDVLGEDRR